MRMVMRVSAVTAALVVLTAGAASAQRPQTRQGFWIAFGLGYGSAKLSCGGCDAGSDGGATGHIRLGGTLNQRLLLGGDVTGWAKEESGVTATVGAVSFVAQYYPMPASGLFVKGGVGYSGIVFVATGQEVTGTGFGLSAGAGYDVRVGRNISITPLVDFLYGGSRELQLNGTTLLDGVSSTLISFGLGVTFH